MSNENIDRAVDDLMNEMQKAVNDDRESNKAGRPALKRLMMSNKVYS
jgi:hypothetical protein